MKRFMLGLLLACLLLAGCGSPDPHPEWDKLARADNLLAAETPQGFSLNESKGALSLNGVYYFTWTLGSGTTITNAEGEDAQVYDCQIYLLAAQCADLAAAEKSVSEWIGLEQKHYSAGEERTITAPSGAFQCLTLQPQKGNSPFTAGAAAFLARKDAAISVEIFAANDFTGDLSEILAEFLNGIHMD